jgi:hypothetical protein
VERTGRDSNPRYCYQYTRSPGVPNRPLWHLSYGRPPWIAFPEEGRGRVTLTAIPDFGNRLSAPSFRQDVPGGAGSRHRLGQVDRAILAQTDAIRASLAARSPALPPIQHPPPNSKPLTPNTRLPESGPWPQNCSLNPRSPASLDPAPRFMSLVSPASLPSPRLPACPTPLFHPLLPAEPGFKPATDLISL